MTRRGNAALRIGSKPAGANEAGGSRSRLELPDEFLPRQDELTFKSLFPSDERLRPLHLCVPIRRLFYTRQQWYRSAVRRNRHLFVYSSIWFVSRCLICSDQIVHRNIIFDIADQWCVRKVKGTSAYYQGKGGVWYALKINKLWMYKIRWQWNREAKQEVATPAAVDLAAPLTCCMRATVIHHGRELGTAPIGRFCGHVVW